MLRESPKNEFIAAILTQSIFLKEYDIAFECTRIFLPELLNIDYHPYFEILLSHFKTDMTKYEVKIALLQRLIPFMNRDHASQIMEIFENVLKFHD